MKCYNCSGHLYEQEIRVMYTGIRTIFGRLARVIRKIAWPWYICQGTILLRENFKCLRKSLWTMHTCNWYGSSNKFTVGWLVFSGQVRGNSKSVNYQYYCGLARVWCFSTSYEITKNLENVIWYFWVENWGAISNMLDREPQLLTEKSYGSF